MEKTGYITRKENTREIIIKIKMYEEEIKILPKLKNQVGESFHLVDARAKVLLMLINM